MPPAVAVPPKRRRNAWQACALALACSALLPACVFFQFARVPYDDVSLAEIKELEQRTREVIADGDRRRLSLKASRQFLRQSQAQLGVVRIRGVNKEAGTYLDDADHAYTALLEHKSPIRASNTAELRAALLNLRGLGQVHGVWLSNPPPSPPSTYDPFEAADRDREDREARERERQRREEEKRREREREKERDRDDNKDKDDDKKKDKD